MPETQELTTYIGITKMQIRITKSDKRSELTRKLNEKMMQKYKEGDIMART